MQFANVSDLIGDGKKTFTSAALPKYLQTWRATRVANLKKTEYDDAGALNKTVDCLQTSHALWKSIPLFSQITQVIQGMQLVVLPGEA